MFSAAEIRYSENQHKASIKEASYLIQHLNKFIGVMTLESIHKGSLQVYIQSREHDGVKKKTINHALEMVRRVLNFAAGDWLDKNGTT